MIKNSYWNNNGRFQMYVEELEALIPSEGEVDEPRKNKALDKFRKASNCYYDLCELLVDYRTFGSQRSTSFLG